MAFAFYNGYANKKNIQAKGSNIFSLSSYKGAMSNQAYFLSARTGGVISRARRSTKHTRLQPRDKTRNGKQWTQIEFAEMREDEEEDRGRLQMIEDREFERRYEWPMYDRLYKLSLQNL